MGIGETLKNAREALGLTIEEAAEKTRIRCRYLEAIEEENFDVLPDDVYVKGFLRSYARLLKLDPEPLVNLFAELHSRKAVEQQEVLPVKVQKRARSGRRSLAFFILAAAVLLAALGVYALREVASFPGNPNQESASGSRDPQFSFGQSKTGSQQVPPPVSPAPAPETPRQKGVNLVLSVVRESCWMRVVVDGEVEFTGELAASQSRSFSGKERIEVKLGNAGAVQVQVNGKDLGYLGERGEVVVREFLAVNEG